ncbi:hypothetical protein KXX11_004471, partial [Aspergillus fumigatus]
MSDHPVSAQIGHAFHIQPHLGQHLLRVLTQGWRGIAQHRRVVAQAQRAGHA